MGGGPGLARGGLLDEETGFRTAALARDEDGESY